MCVWSTECKHQPCSTLHVPKTFLQVTQSALVEDTHPSLHLGGPVCCFHVTTVRFCVSSLPSWTHVVSVCPWLPMLLITWFRCTLRCSPCYVTVPICGVYKHLVLEPVGVPCASPVLAVFDWTSDCSDEGSFVTFWLYLYFFQISFLHGVAGTCL